MINFLKKLFLVESKVNELQNMIAHLGITYAESKLAIKEADECCEKTKTLIREDFEKLKKETIESTREAIAKLNFSIGRDVEKLDSKYFAAKAKLDEKETAINGLVHQLSKLNITEFEL